jgi:hypothetical protein
LATSAKDTALDTNRDRCVRGISGTAARSGQVEAVEKKNLSTTRTPEHEVSQTQHQRLQTIDAQRLR